MRGVGSILLVVLGWPVLAQEPTLTDRVVARYLSETVRRGLPRHADGSELGAVPFWPTLDAALRDARSLEPSDDLTLVDAWVKGWEGQAAGNLSALQGPWPTPQLTHFGRRDWGETLFADWRPELGAARFTDAWLAWDDKAYSPSALLRGLGVLEVNDPSAIPPLLTQARQLYPEDRRFLPLALRHPDAVPLAPSLVARDLTRTGGFGPQALASAVGRQSAQAAAWAQAGYPPAVLDPATGRDYGLWLTTTQEKPADGAWMWDQDRDGVFESHLVFAAGLPVTWSRSDGEGLWTVRFAGVRPSEVTERRGGAVWTLRYEAYPTASQLEYRWNDQRLVYRFPPLEVSAALWPEDRFRAGSGRLVGALAEVWLPLDPRLLASKAASIENWVGPVRARTLALANGQVWLAVEDTNLDGRDDQWSYFRSGHLASVYRNPEGQGTATLRELYRQGELTQVQSRQAAGSKTEFALFPAEGVQLWDSHGQGRPIDRLFRWEGDRLQALVFSGADLPWQTMPGWEPRP